jgi:hypothetical protein
METGGPQDEASHVSLISQGTEAQVGGEETKPVRTKRRPIKRVIPLTDEEVREAEGFGTDDKMSAEWKILVENDETDWLRSYLKVVLDLNAHYQRGKPRLWVSFSFTSSLIFLIVAYHELDIFLIYLFLHLFVSEAFWPAFLVVEAAKITTRRSTFVSQ